MRAWKSMGVYFTTLSKRWGISPSLEKWTITRTTLQGVRTCLNPTLSRCFPTNDRMLRHKLMPHPCFTDTLIAGYAQVYATSFAWSCTHPMAKKGVAHEILPLLLQQDGIPPVMIMDGSKEQTQGKFRHKLRQDDCHKRQTKPYSPWMNAAEGCICELKQGMS